jgi:hypothetical protein
MTSIADIVASLTQALVDRDRLPTAITEFQAKIWRDEVAGPPDVIELLRDLAYDLDYVEPDPAVRIEDESFQDLDRAEREIRQVLSRIRGS